MDERESGNEDQVDSESKDNRDRGQDAAKPRPAPGPRKIGEQHGNLRKREEWFRKRSG